MLSESQSTKASVSSYLLRLGFFLHFCLKSRHIYYVIRTKLISLIINFKILPILPNFHFSYSLHIFSPASTSAIISINKAALLTQIIANHLILDYCRLLPSLSPSSDLIIVVTNIILKFYPLYLCTYISGIFLIVPVEFRRSRPLNGWMIFAIR